MAEGVLLVLAEHETMHGYDLIAELEQRSDGRWRPSPGSMYPALGRLEHKGLIVGNEDGDGKRSYQLTDEGRAFVSNRDPDAPLPWEPEETGPRGTLRPLVAEVAGQARQIGRFGTAEQRAEAVEVLTETKKKLYAVLAE